MRDGQWLSTMSWLASAGSLDSFSIGPVAGVGETSVGHTALLHTDRYIAANSPKPNRWLQPSTVVICASTVVARKRRDGGKYARSAGSRKSSGRGSPAGGVTSGP